MAKARFTHPLYLFIFGFLAVWMPGFLLAPARGGGFEVLRSFSRTGVAPSGLVFGPNGDLYGTTNAVDGSSTSGTLYSVNPQTGAVTTVGNIGEGDGNPAEQIVADGTSVYGVTGGTVVWSWAPASGFKTVFGTTYETTYEYRYAGLTLDNNGGLVGLLLRGPLSQLWRWTPSGGLTVLATFAEETTGPVTPTKLAVDSQGGIYGCFAIVNQKSILWRWRAGAGFEKLAELPVATFGASVPGVSIDANGRVWGSTVYGGAHQDGTLWRWTSESGAEKLGDFNSPDANGHYASPITFAADGTPLCHSGNIIWKWTAAGGLVEHADLSSPEIGVVGGAIAFDAAGAFFGTSGFGSPVGRIWKWTAAGGVVKLQDSPDASVPLANQGLARDAQGRLYGTTSSTKGLPTTLWRWGNAGGYEELANFDPEIYGWGKTFPALDSEGNVYGVAVGDSGVNRYGKLWQWNGAEGLVKLANYASVAGGSRSESNIVIGSGGAIYGTGSVPMNPYSRTLIWKRTADRESQSVWIFVGVASFSLGQVTGLNGEWYGTGTPGLWSYSEMASVAGLSTKRLRVMRLGIFTARRVRSTRQHRRSSGNGTRRQAFPLSPLSARRPVLTLSACTRIAAV